jgi:competence protein ComEC
MLLTAIIVTFCFWIMEKRKLLIWLALFCTLSFFVLRTRSFLHASQQKKLIVYNVPRHRVIDLIDGRNAGFIADTQLLNNDFLKNFHLKPSRIGDRIISITPVYLKNFEFCKKRIVIVDSSFNLRECNIKTQIDLAIISGNPKFFIPAVVKNFSPKQIVIDSSVPQWKSKRWKKDCDSLHIPCHNVSEEGAFVINL